MSIPNEAVEAAARAIRFAENPLDGDCIGVMIHLYDHLDGSLPLERQIELIDGVCRVAATAALTAALPLVRAQVLVEAAKVADELDDEVLRGHDYGERASSRIRAIKENHNG